MFELELETYKAKLPELRDSEGKYALIQGRELIDVYGTYDDAIKAAYERFGLERPFLVKQVRALEQVQFISRLAAPTVLD